MNAEGTQAAEAQIAPVRHVARSDIGMRREENQDSFGLLTHETVQAFVVADGMGGVRGGAVASGLAIETFEKVIKSFGVIEPESIIQSVQEANSEIHDRGNREAGLAGMGTTFVGLIFVGTDLYCVNVGDSRAYRIRQATLEQLTEDHTLVMELLRSGTISADQVHNHPVSHMLTRSLGPSDYVDVDCWLCEDGPLAGDRYVLCSDGLYNLVTDEEILSIVNSKPLEEAVDALINLANQRGGTDNITVIALEIDSNFITPARVQAFFEAQQNTTPEEETEGESRKLGYTSADGEHPSGQNLWLDIEYLEDSGLADTNGDVSEEEHHATSDYQEGDEQIGADGDAVHDATSAGDRDVEEPVSGSEDGRPEHERFDSASESNDEKDDESEDKTDDASEQTEESAFTKAETEQFERPDLRATAEGGRKRRGFVGALLGVIPYLFCASLGGVAAAVLLYAPDQPAPDLAQVVESFSTTERANQTSTPADTTAPDTTTREVEEVSAPIDQGNSQTDVTEDRPISNQDGDTTEQATEIDESAAASITQETTETDHPLPVVAKEKESIKIRETMLRDRLVDIDEKLRAFDGPLSGRLGEILKTAGTERQQLTQRIEAVRREIDIATRKLAIWYGRRKRLESTQPLELASEVAVTSEAVQKKKEEFESITWEYLKQSEHLRYNPNDPIQVRKVAELLKQRKAKLDEVSQSVRDAIDGVIGEADQKITELTVERDNLEAQLQRIQSDVDLVKVISSGDQAAREAKKSEIQHERELTLAELEELMSESTGHSQENLQEIPVAPELVQGP